MTALANGQRQKLIRVLGMLGSDHDGERASAGLHASRILKDAGITWEGLLTPMQQHRQDDRPNAAPVGWLGKVGQLVERRDELSDWEFSFVLSIARRPALSTKQRTVLEQLFDKVCV